MSRDVNPLLLDLDDRLSGLSAAPDAFMWPVIETVAHWCEPFSVAAATKGTRTATLVLDAGDIWVWFRVRHWLDDSRWEFAPIEARVQALRDALWSAECGTRSELHALVAGWADTQTDHTGKGGVVIMTMSDWGMNGSARRLLADLDGHLGLA